MDTHPEHSTGTPRKQAQHSKTRGADVDMDILPNSPTGATSPDNSSGNTPRTAKDSEAHDSFRNEAVEEKPSLADFVESTIFVTSLKGEPQNIAGAHGGESQSLLPPEVPDLPALLLTARELMETFNEHSFTIHLEGLCIFWRMGTAVLTPAGYELKGDEIDQMVYLLSGGQ